MSGFHAVGSVYKEVLHVGDERTPFAHADMFVANDAQTRVYEPIADWLARVANVPLD